MAVFLPVDMQIQSADPISLIRAVLKNVLASLQLTPALHTPITQSEETGYVCSLSTMHNINAVRQLGVRSLR